MVLYNIYIGDCNCLDKVIPFVRDSVEQCVFSLHLYLKFLSQVVTQYACTCALTNPICDVRGIRGSSEQHCSVY